MLLFGLKAIFCTWTDETVCHVTRLPYRPMYKQTITENTLGFLLHAAVFPFIRHVTTITVWLTMNIIHLTIVHKCDNLCSHDDVMP